MGDPEATGWGGALLGDRFELRRPLGQGGSGVVHRAHDRLRRTEVALKQLRRSGDPDDILRFKREFRALADIAHPNLVTLYELQTDGDDWFFTMELVEGVSFIEYVRPHLSARAASETEVTRTMQSAVSVEADGTLSVAASAAHRQRIIDASLVPERLDAALYQLVDGVHALHLAGKLHRDLKPSNVLVEPSGRLVLLDFGLIADIAATGSGAGPDRAAGTPLYMSPEQAAGAPLTEASDWYGVGVMLYEALTGRRPFEGAPAAILAAKQYAAPPPAGSLVSGAPDRLDRLCRALLATDPAARPAGLAILATLGRAPSAATLGVAGAAPPFVGRQSELAVLRHALEDSRAGGVAVFVRGPSGMGKSALLRHFLDGAAADGALVLEGRCYERESVPYKALDTLVDALTAQLDRLEPGLLRELLPRDIAALARLFPVLRRLPAIAAAEASTAQPPDPLELRRRGVGALRELLARLTARQPVVLAIDDLQWGDADSAAFLADLVHDAGAPPILLVVAHRSEDEAGNPILSTVRRRSTGLHTAAGGRLRELTVGGLSEREARELLERVEPAEPAAAAAAGASGTAGDPGRTAALLRDCGGSPFFLTELARGRAHGDGSADLDGVLRAHVVRLPDEARALLEVCAVAARPLSTSLALRAAGLDREGSAIGTLRAERLLRVGRARDTQQLEPYHDRIREAVVGGLDPEARRARHGALARALESDGGGHHEALVTHWLEAGEPRLAGRHAPHAAAAAEQALAFHQAARLYALAIEHGALDADARRLMQTRQGHVLAFAGRLDESAAAFAAAAAGASPDDALELRRLEIEQLLRAGQADQATEGMHTLLDAIGVRVPRSRAGQIASIVGQSLLLRLRGNTLHPPRGPLDPKVERRVAILMSLSTGMAFINPVVGRVLQLRLMRDALDSGEPRFFAMALALDFGYLAGTGVDAEPAIAGMRERGLAMARALDDVFLEGWIEGCSGFADYMLGHWRSADRKLRKSYEVLRDRCTGVRWQLDMAEVFFTANLICLGNTAELVRAVPAFLRDAQARGDRLSERCMRSWRANTTWLVLDLPDEAEANIDAVVPPRRQGDAFHLMHNYEMLARGQIALYRGDGINACRRISENWRDLQRSGLLRVQTLAIEAWFLRGRCAVAASEMSDGRAAVSLLKDAERAATVIERTRAPWGQPFARLLRATVAHRRSDPAAARTGLAAAIDGFVQTEASLYEQAARLRLGRLLGGTDGTAMADAAHATMARGAVVDPEAMADVLAPGWEASARRRRQSLSSPRPIAAGT